MDEAASNQRTVSAPQLSPRDMVLSESFHRLKRTALLLSTALIVLGLASVPDPAVFKLAFTDVSLDVRWVHVLLSAGAIYYAVGFWFEVQVARQTHGAHMEGSDESQFVLMMGRLSKRLADEQKWHMELGERLAGVVNDLEDRMATAESVTHSLKTDVEKAVRSAIQSDRNNMATWHALPVAVRKSPPPDPDRPTAALVGDVLEIFKTGGSGRPFGDVPAELAQMNLHIARWTTRAEALSGSLQDLHTRMGRLAPDIVRARKLSFWGFEVAGVAAPLALGLVLTWFPYVDRVAAEFAKPRPEAVTADEAAAIAADAANQVYPVTPTSPASSQ